MAAPPDSLCLRTETAAQTPSDEFLVSPNHHRLYKYKSSLDPLKKSIPGVMRNISFYPGLGPRVSDNPDLSATSWRPDVARYMHDGTGLLKLHRRRVGPPIITPDVCTRSFVQAPIL